MIKKSVYCYINDQASEKVIDVQSKDVIILEGILI
jgi:uridine kinase